MEKVLSVTLARGGSKGIPYKNLALINGIPLLAYTIAEARMSGQIDEVLVSSDNIEILATAYQYGATPILRPSHLSQDTSKPIECIQHAVNFYEEKNDIKEKYPFIVELLCTNPFKTSDDIDHALKIQLETNADSVIAVMPLEDHHPIRIKKLEDGFIRDFCLEEIPESRRQDLKPQAYIRNGSIYSMRRDMMDKGTRYGTEDSRAYIMPRERTVNIDEPMDLLFADMLMSKNPREYVKPLMDYDEAFTYVEKEYFL
jgi:CMP-N-acetylneuraminic acid synthetase|tara:strand:+ start:11769 stop:12539 length:771 start_codon:yes stop_codon:yes gene_type:complete